MIHLDTQVILFQMPAVLAIKIIAIAAVLTLVLKQIIHNINSKRVIIVCMITV